MIDKRKCQSHEKENLSLLKRNINAEKKKQTQIITNNKINTCSKQTSMIAK